MLSRRGSPDAGVGVVTSPAGRVARPRLPVGQLYVGGFGDVGGLVAYLREHEALVRIVDPPEIALPRA